ncbi:uncharacterized protein LOC117107163 isoform X1 [Anneissia japonica]|uniref:uncharacterized protein LOC117107163 isoform X1 n=2 Tax=Anneissia japonica TaxID=1529436 RepID=UPI0014259E99|nr:uncharacterized protein LOC117107163 isoform X1 [Anneissia japonica]
MLRKPGGSAAYYKYIGILKMQHIIIAIGLSLVCTAVTSVGVQTSNEASTKNAIVKLSPELRTNSPSATITDAETNAEIFAKSFSAGATLQGISTKPTKGTTVSSAVTSEHISFTSSERAESRTPSTRMSTTGAFNVSVESVGSFDAEKVTWHLPPVTTRIKHYIVLNYKQNCNSGELLDSKIDSKKIISNVTINSLIIDNLSYLTTYCVCVISIAGLDEDVSGINNCKEFTTDYNHMNTKAVIALGIASSFIMIFCIVVIYNVLRSAKKLSRQSHDEELIASVYNDVSSEDEQLPPPTAT